MIRACRYQASKWLAPRRYRNGFGGSDESADSLGGIGVIDVRLRRLEPDGPDEGSSSVEAPDSRI
jgi:hypothetical protein